MDVCEAKTSPKQTGLLLISQDNVILASFLFREVSTDVPHQTNVQR